MELELGLKLTRVLDDVTTTDLLIAKDKAGPLVISRETDTMFILIAYLKGYKRENIKIDINEDGTKIAVSGRRPVQEMEMVRWRVVKKAIEMRGFRKAFKIPEGVILDKIKAKFSVDESTLTITMPKKVKGFWGIGIEEVKEYEINKRDSETRQIVADEVSEQVCKEPETKPVEESDQAAEKQPESTEIECGKAAGGLTLEKAETASPNVAFPEKNKGKEVHNVMQEPKHESQEEERKTTGGELEVNDHIRGFIVSTKSAPDQVAQQTESPSLPSGDRAPVVEGHATDDIPRSKSEIQEKSEEKQTRQHIREPLEPKDGQELGQAETLHLKQPTDEDQYNKDPVVHGRVAHGTEEDSTTQKSPQEAQASESLGKKQEELHDLPTQPEKLHEEDSKLCVPILAGSALLVSFIVLVFHLIKGKTQASRRRH